MIKTEVSCDFCGEKQEEQPTFIFEVHRIEAIKNLITGQPEQQKENLQICKKCYDKHLKKIIYDQTTNKKSK